MTASTRDRRLAAVIAGHRGDPGTATRLLEDPSAEVRDAALGALCRLGAIEESTVRRLLGDPDPRVRRRAVEAAIAFPDVDLVPLLGDPNPRVVDTAAFTLGERDHDPSPVHALADTARTHPDELCRESAVAAIGALGAHRDADHRLVVDTLIAALADRPPIRRRAVIGLHQYDDVRAVAAVRSALEDRDRQVRALAGELLGEPVD